MPTRISWTEETINPVPFCSKVSEGCRHCYAERLSLANRWTTLPWTAANAKHNLRYFPERMEKLRQWKSPKMVFLNSMGDLFHELVLDEWLTRILGVVRDCPQHTIQILTKRIARAATWEFPPNVWLGTSVEDERVKSRIDMLRAASATVRFISFEPLIAPVGELDLSGIHWVIVGGESGAGFRKMDHAWARAIRDQCVAQSVPFFFKQDSSLRSGVRPYLNEVSSPPSEWKQYPAVVSGEHALPIKPSAGGKQMELF